MFLPGSSLSPADQERGHILTSTRGFCAFECARPLYLEHGKENRRRPWKDVVEAAVWAQEPAPPHIWILAFVSETDSNGQ